MSRKVFYSFNFERDCQRAAQVRNSHAIADQDEYGVIDSVDWEDVKKGGVQAIKNWIDEQLKYTSATVVLIGADTAGRKWVDYEISQSWIRGNGLVGVRIHNVKKLDGSTDTSGPNPFDSILLADNTPLSSVCKTYDWVTDNGLNNLGQWAEEAFQIRANYNGEKNLKDNEQTSQSRTTPTPSYQSSGPTVITNPPRPWAM